MVVVESDDHCLWEWFLAPGKVFSAHQVARAVFVKIVVGSMEMPVENTATILGAENEPSASVASRLERFDMRAVSDL